MADQTFDGKKLRLLTIVDNFSRVSPARGRTNFTEIPQAACLLSTSKQFIVNFGKMNRNRASAVSLSENLGEAITISL